MSDLKMECPGCEAWTSEVGRAYRDGEPCPYCGLPAEATALVLKAQERNIDGAVVQRMVDAEKRATAAEQEANELRNALNSVRRAIGVDPVYKSRA